MVDCVSEDNFTMYLKKLKFNFGIVLCKKPLKKVGKIDTCRKFERSVRELKSREGNSRHFSSQFHQHFMQEQLFTIFLYQKLQSITSCIKKLRKKLFHEKAARKMLVKLTPGLFYIQDYSDRKKKTINQIRWKESLK